ncbi:DUF3048 domain-containing protein [Clostridium estertheticum]|uniref:DUF3048 domain-containing protein n=1 Tax=Clostridium estertheticum TaxID=238834 RepID=UPI001CF31FC9|nr:DUF3048 domain-containing protein [Clostridium estertheticum]MCB2361784.1 DUF3048 domain-containing protein [Clostridium estertheticum]
MKNKSKLLLCILVSMFFLSQGCGKKADTTIQLKPKPAVKTSQKYISPYTGEEVTKTVFSNIAVLAIVENSLDARPQSGLNDADIVYETMAEGGIPRFITLFQKESPKKIGPIRSARAYFLDISKEYNLPFAHCGGSEEALLKINGEKLMSMNEMTNASTYWRDSIRKAPHNLYTSTDKLRELIKIKKFVYSPSVTLKFNKSYWDNTKLNKASDIFLTLNKYYNTRYTYKNGLYLKSMDGKSSTDKENKLPLSVKNVVVQITTIKTQADGSHLDIKLVGTGNGYVISNGKYVKMFWSKKTTTSKTLLTDEKGNVLPLNPGKTWWNIVDKNAVVDIK